MQQPSQSNEIETEKIELTISPETTYQAVSSFGASGAWWSQDVGGWTQDENKDVSKRDYIAELLFDPVKGIGLSSYRYNVGAGSGDSGNSPEITDPWRKSQSFETSPKVYDWSRDQNAQYMLKKAVSYGVDQIYFFANSPLERLTKSGHAYGVKNKDSFSNLNKENYGEFIDYLFDVTEHFRNEGIPVHYLSPINEPQWEWIGGQEGAHYTPQEVVDFSKQIFEAKKVRETLKDVELSVPELGEWANTSMAYYEAMINDPTFMSYYPTWDIHSYWSNKLNKTKFLSFLKSKNVDVTLKMSEWTEMVNGKDMTMDSALNLANQIIEDLTILQVTDWQYWIAVSAYDYRDGLIYVNPTTKEIEPSRRLWTMGNFSKFIRPGATRIDVKLDDIRMKSVGFKSPDSDSITVVLTNESINEKEIVLGDEWKIEKVSQTTQEADLSQVDAPSNVVKIPNKSVTTIQLKKAK